MDERLRQEPLCCGTRRAIAGQFIAAAEIEAGGLAFAPATGTGIRRASLVFQVGDGGSLDRGGGNPDPLPKTLSFDMVPVAAGDSYTTGETLDVSPLDGLLANDTDADGDPLTVVLVAGPQHGVLAINPDGSFRYTPNTDFHGSDAFQYPSCPERSSPPRTSRRDC